MWCNAHAAELRCAVGRVILKVRAGAATFGITDSPFVVDGGVASRLPVHAIEDHQNDVLLPGLECRALQCREIRLVAVLSVGIQRIRWNAAVNSLQSRFAAVGAVFSRVTVEIDSDTRSTRSEGVDRNQPIAVSPPLLVVLGINAPVSNRGLTVIDCGGLQIAQVIGGDGCSGRRDHQYESQTQLPNHRPHPCSRVIEQRSSDRAARFLAVDGPTS